MLWPPSPSASRLGIPLAECCAALENLRPEEKRGQVLTIRGATLINDAYNSNPEALKSMIRTLAAMPAQRRILVAGEMLELGPEAEALHAACGKAARPPVSMCRRRPRPRKADRRGGTCSWRRSDLRGDSGSRR